MPHAVSKMRVAPTDGPLNLFSVRIQQQFVMIKTMALLRSVRAVDAVSVQLPGTHLGQIAVPYHVSLFGKRDANTLAPPRIIKQAELYFLCVLGVQREVDALAIPG